MIHCAYSLIEVNHSGTLKNTLFSTYDKELRPVKHVSHRTTVEIDLELIKIEKFDVISELLIVDVWMWMVSP